MDKFKLILLLALFLVLSCSDLGRDNPLDPKSDKYVSSSSLGISSSSESSSSSAESSSSELSSSSRGLCGDFVEGTKREHYNIEKRQFCDERDGKKYVYVEIGEFPNEQTWMAENLNYYVSGGNSKCYSDNNNNCTTYGRLYNWATANTACPKGWHLPTDEEWTELVNFVGTSTAGVKLKAKSEWKTSTANGTDDYGFSALPGGSYHDQTSFKDVNNIGTWWTATPYHDSNYFLRSMNYSYGYVSSVVCTNACFYSVRCVKDNID